MSEKPVDNAASARNLLRRGLKGALATLDAESGAPYASMVLTATDISGAALTLISTLARHTRNLAANPAASLMIDVSDAAGDAESGGRITLMGAFRRVADPAMLASIRSRFIARHPAAQGYASFGDFAFYRFEAASAHYIEGFGRIIPLPGSALQPPSHDLAAFAAAEPSAIAGLSQRWPHVTGLDCEGIDLRYGERAVRHQFASTVKNVTEATRLAAEILNGQGVA